MLCLIFLILSLISLPIVYAKPPDDQTFIVSIQNDLKPSAFPNFEAWYNSILETTSPASDSDRPTILYTYKTAFHGFSATLTSQQILQLRSHPAVLSISPDHIYQIQTTRSPEFLGLKYDDDVDFPGELTTLSDQGSKVVIGILDSGIWPERRSFNDDGMPPMPAHWKGECDGGSDFSCNKKLVGARYFIESGGTARDDVGHGTHTASTAAGRAVRNASLLLGEAVLGEARGIAPKARIAVYRVCGNIRCSASDVLAGMDKAIEDGVDVLSISLGGASVRYSDDPIAIAAFTAAERGIFVSAAAGNFGPYYGSVTNVAPWIATIGASTIDRSFPASIVLEKGEVLQGVSLYGGGDMDEFNPLLYVGNDCSDETAFYRPEAVRGKIVVCKTGGFSGQVEKSMVVQRLGGVGVVVVNTDTEGEVTNPEPVFIPGLNIPYSATKKLMSYLKENSTHINPKGKLIFPGPRPGFKPAPVVTGFSSRGPNPESRYILKPDLIAPGMEILAAWPDNLSVSSLPEDKRKAEFNILSGTSMSCPHVSGVAALLKGAHPDWSPAMIRSALMTTANLQDRFGNPLLVEFNYTEATIWDTGAGHVDPEKANDPGLVYDLKAQDYIEFMCASNYSTVDIGKIAKRKVSCSGSKPWDLNYPAIVIYPPNHHGSGYLNVVMKRSATHVGKTLPSTYNVWVTNPKGATVTVDPPMLEFNTEGETLSFNVRIKARKSSSWFEVGALVWSNGAHNVSSPVVVGWGSAFSNS